MTSTLQVRSLAPTRTAMLALMVALSAMSYFDRTIMSIAGPTIIHEFSLSPTEMGAVYSAFLLSYTLFMTPGGALADRFGPRLLLAFVSFGSALFTGLTALCGRPGLGSLIGVIPSFLIVRLLFGVCTAPLYPACGRMTANWFPPSQSGRVQGFILSAAALGSAISPIAFAPLVGAVGWRMSFTLAAVATAALFAVWLWRAADHPGSTPATAAAHVQPVRWRALASNRNLVLLTISYFGLNYFEYIFFYWIYYYFGEIRKMSPTESAIYVTVLMLTMVVTTPLGGWISDWLVARTGRKSARRAIVVPAMASSAVLLIAGASGNGVFAVVALLSLAFGCATASEGPFWASAIDAGGENVGAACGLLNTGGNIGGVCAPILTPIIASAFGWSWGLYAGSAIIGASVLLWLFVDLDGRVTNQTVPTSCQSEVQAG